MKELKNEELVSSQEATAKQTIPTDPTDPRWPIPPIFKPSPTFPVEILSDGSFEIMVGRTKWVFDPSRKRLPMICNTGSRTTTEKCFLTFSVDTIKSEDRIDMTLKFSSINNIEGILKFQSMKTVDENKRKINAGVILYSANDKNIFSIHYSKNCPTFKLLIDDHDIELDVEWFQNTLLLFGLSVKHAFDDNHLRFSKGQDEGAVAFNCDTACAGAGGAIGAGAGGAFAIGCTGASWGAGAPLCTYAGGWIAAGAGTLAYWGCGELFC